MSSIGICDLQFNFTF